MLPSTAPVGINDLMVRPPRTRELGRKSGRLLAEIVDFAAAALEKSGIPGPDSRRLAINVVSTLSDNMGGTTLYLPKGETAKLVTRDASIYSEYSNTPESVTALARKHGLSEIAVYRILDKQRELRRAAA